MGQSVLIVEDEPVLARNLRTSLERCGYLVGTTGSAEDALRLIALSEPQLMIADYRLPGIDGVQLIARVRSSAPRVRALLLSGHHNPLLAGEAIRRGAAACLGKPIALDELRRVVAGLIGVPPVLPERPLASAATRAA